MWDCYTCHGYKDSDAAVDNTNNPGNLDRHINTGAHDRHTRTVAKGGMGYDCVRCPATGNATLYIAAAPAGDNTYPGTHKTGFVEWTFAGAPNPFNVAAASLTYSGSAQGGAGFAPTDNADSTHRRYGSCANLYCHSIGQHPTTGLALATNDNTHYRPPKWDNTFGGKCGDCHGGNGATDNAASIMTSGSHRQHDNTAPYAFGCATCHNGLGRVRSSATTPRATSATDQVMSAVLPWWRSVPLTDSRIAALRGWPQRTTGCSGASGAERSKP